MRIAAAQWRYGRGIPDWGCFLFFPLFWRWRYVLLSQSAASLHQHLWLLLHLLSNLQSVPQVFRSSSTTLRRFSNKTKSLLSRINSLLTTKPKFYLVCPLIPCQKGDIFYLYQAWSKIGQITTRRVVRIGALASIPGRLLAIRVIQLQESQKDLLPLVYTPFRSQSVNTRCFNTG